MANINGRMMPHNIEAEQAVIGCSLLDKDAAIAIISLIEVSDFYSESHQIIFDAIKTITLSNKAVDFIIVSDQLIKNNQLDVVGGIEYLTMLTNVVPSASNYEYYCDIVKRDSMLRNLISASQKIIDKAYNSDNEDTLAFAEKQIFDISAKEDKSSLTPIKDALVSTIDKFEKLSTDKDSFRGLITGFKEFDNITNGLQRGDLILLAARPAVGKSSFALNIITNAAINNGAKVALFSLEMPATQIAQRAVCSVGLVSLSNALKGELNINEWKAIWAANKKLSDAKIFIDDSSVITPAEILSKCRRIAAENGGLDLIMIDYLQLMSSSSKRNSDNRQQEVSDFTRGLKIAARELNVPILVLSQLSRAVEIRKDHTPMLSDLRESGAIEQDADIVMFLHKPENYADIENVVKNEVKLIVAKHRNGAIGELKLKWIPEYTRFMDGNENKFVQSIEENIPPINDYKDLDLPFDGEENEIMNFDEE